MNKLSYKLTHKQANVLCMLFTNLCTNIRTTPANLLASAVLIEYSLSLSRKLLVVYKGEKKVAIPYTAALAVNVLFQHVSIDKLDALQMALLLPIINDVDRKIVNPQ